MFEIVTEGEIQIVNCSAVVMCDQGMLWHGGQGGPAAGQVTLAGSRNARDWDDLM